MRATKNGWTIEGTPAEIKELLEMSAYSDTVTNTVKGADPEKVFDQVKKSDKTRRKNVAESLFEAGWSPETIAEELRTAYRTLYGHFNPAKKPGRSEDEQEIHKR